MDQASKFLSYLKISSPSFYLCPLTLEERPVHLYFHAYFWERYVLSFRAIKKSPVSLERFSKRYPSFILSPLPKSQWTNFLNGWIREGGKVKERSPFFIVGSLPGKTPLEVALVDADWLARPRKMNPDMVETFEHSLLKAYLTENFPVLALHAASIQNNHIGILITGPSGAGKTTAAAFFIRRGWHSVSRDCSYLFTRREGIYLLDPFTNKTYPLRGMILKSQKSPSLLSAAEKYQYLLNQCHIEGSLSEREEGVKKVTQLVSQVPLYLCSWGDSPDQMKRHFESLHEHITTQNFF